MNTKERLASLFKIKKSSESCAEETSKCINEVKESFSERKAAVCRDIEGIVSQKLQAFLKSEGYSFDDVDIELGCEKEFNKMYGENGMVIATQSKFEVSLKVKVEL